MDKITVIILYQQENNTRDPREHTSHVYTSDSDVRRNSDIFPKRIGS